MRNRFLAIFFVAASCALFSTEASAWICQARSTGTTNWGRGWHPHSLEYAKRRALLECAVRTPRRYRCVITGCV